MEREAGEVIQMKGTTRQTQRNMEMHNVFRDRQEVQNSYMGLYGGKRKMRQGPDSKGPCTPFKDIL